MNREIKYRGLTSNGNWVCGNLIQGKNGYCYICSINENPVYKNGDYWYIDSPCYVVIPETVGQFTGFKDFDEKDIYEGDILEYVSYMRDENKRKEIVGFDEKCGGWYVHKQADTLSDILFKQHNEEWQLKQNYKPSIKHKVRVIGNIYENPEFTQTTS